MSWNDSLATGAFQEDPFAWAQQSFSTGPFPLALTTAPSPQPGTIAGTPMDVDMTASRLGFAKISTGGAGRAFTPDDVAHLTVTTPGDVPEPPGAQLWDLGPRRTSLSPYYGVSPYHLDLPRVTAPVRVQTEKDEIVRVYVGPTRAIITVRELSDVTIVPKDSITPDTRSWLVRQLDSLGRWLIPNADPGAATRSITGSIRGAMGDLDMW